ncbi:MAG: IgGFc-binding protein [Polyangiaceae bacterium]|nr:IgGFc-binding protein [Polyangiaceae bacterium]
MLKSHARLPLMTFVASLATLHCSATGSGTDPGGGGPGTGGGGGIGLGGTAGAGGSGALVGIGGGGTGGTGTPECDGAEQKTSSGCDYYAVVPSMTLGANGGCFAVFVVNPWEKLVQLKVSFKGQELNPNLFGFIPTGQGASLQYKPMTNSAVPPGEVAILFLNRFGGSPLGLDTSCPPGIVPAISTMDAATHGTAIGAAFHITTSIPVVAYDIYPYGGGRSAMTSATLLLPTSSWGDNYIGVSPLGNGAPIGAAPILGIVAHQDDTAVTISPSAAIVGGNGVPGTAQGTPATYTLGKGQHLQFTQAAALDGSAIQATAPIGVWAGMSAFNVEGCCADSAHQQIPPVRALGSEYVAVRYRNRYDGIEESPPWRIVGAVNGTQLTYEPSQPPGAPSTLNLGSVALFNAPGPFIVRSQDDKHPFYMAAYMTGASKYDPGQQSPPTGPDDGRGDAEFVNIIPPGEYLDRYVFFADPTYPETNLVLVRTKGANGFQDVTLDCAGVLTGWQPIGSSGKYEYTRFDLVRHNFQPQGNCNNGRREISSPAPFALTVWGWGSAATGQQLSGTYSQYVSYAYPGGASVAPINNVVIPPVPR